MVQLVKGGAAIDIVFFALVSFWPALDSEPEGVYQIDRERQDFCVTVRG